MHVQPQKRYVVVRYPTHDDVDQRPDLLANVPVRWQTNPAVLTALASVTMLSASSAALAQRNGMVSPRGAPLLGVSQVALSPGAAPMGPPRPPSLEDEVKRVIHNIADFLFPPQRVLMGLRVVVPPAAYHPTQQSAMIQAWLDGNVRFQHAMGRPETVAESIIFGPRRLADVDSLLPAGKAEAEITGEQVRAQVRDFVEWLKVQGVI